MTAPVAERRVRESTFTIVCNGFADGPAQALRDHLLAEGAQRVVMVSHPLTPEGGGGHVVDVHEGGGVTTHTLRAPHRPPATYPLDLVVPLRLPACDLWVGFNPLAALRGLAERRIGRAGKVVTWNVDFVPDRFGPGLATKVYDRVDRLVATHADGRVELSEAAREGRERRLGLRAGHMAPVSIVPGEIALTLTGASSTASPAVTASTAALVAATASIPGVGFSAVAPDMNRKDPPAGSFLPKCLASSSGPVTFVANEALTRSPVRSA